MSMIGIKARLLGVKVVEKGDNYFIVKLPRWIADQREEIARRVIADARVMGKTVTPTIGDRLIRFERKHLVTLDLRDQKIDLDSVLAAINELVPSRSDPPPQLVITPEQESALLAEWSVAGVSEPVPKSLDSKKLWGSPVQVRSIGETNATSTHTTHS